MFCSKTLPGWAGLFRGRLGHMLGALDLTRPIVRADKAMQAKTMVHIGEEGGEQLRGCTMRSFPDVSTHSRGKNSLGDNVLTACTTVYASLSHKMHKANQHWLEDLKEPLENADRMSQ